MKDTKKSFFPSPKPPKQIYTLYYETNMMMRHHPLYITTSDVSNSSIKFYVSSSKWREERYLIQQEEMISIIPTTEQFVKPSTPSTKTLIEQDVPMVSVA